MANKHTNLFLVVARAALAVAALTLPLMLAGAEPEQKAAVPRKKIIAWGGLDWYSPENVQMNIRKYEELPFDGTVLQGFKANQAGKQVMFDSLCFGKEKFERQQLAETIELLKNIKFKTFTDNLVRFNVTPGDVDWFEDFSPILHNARLWAEVAKETGMKGWLFDVEDYQGRVFDYRKMKFTGKKTFDEYAQQARLRGREFMKAVQEPYPDIVMFLVLAHSYVNRDPQASKRLPELEYGLLPAFLSGMIEAAGPKVRIIDGHEQSYVYLTSEDYYRGYHATRQKALALVPPDLHAKYRTTVEAGMALYFNYVFASPGVAKGPPEFLTEKDRLQLFEHNVYYALTTTDEYVWCYSERLCWWEKGHAVPTPEGALDALRRARAKYENDQPLGFDMAERIAAARAREKKDGRPQNSGKQQP